MSYPLLYVAQSSLEIARYDLRRLERLTREGFEVHVLAGDDGGVDDLLSRGISCKAVPAAQAAWPGSYFILQGYVLETRPVLVHGVDWPWAWLAAVAARQVDAATVATVPEHAIGSLRALHPLLRRALRRFIPLERDSLYTWLAKRVDRYLCTNERDFQWCQEQEVVPGPKLEMLIGGRGIDLELFSPGEHEESREELRRRAGFSPRCRRVIGLAAEGGIEFAADLGIIVEKMRRVHPSVGWLIGGEAAKALSAQLPGRLQDTADIRVLPGRCDAEFYECLDVLAHPVRRDPWSLPIVQAGALEVPSVAFDLSSTSSAIREGETGFLVQRGDIQKFTGVLARFANDPRRLRDYGRKARSHVEARFDRRQIDEQILHVYDRVLRPRMS